LRPYVCVILRIKFQSKSKPLGTAACWQELQRRSAERLLDVLWFELPGADCLDSWRLLSGCSQRNAQWKPQFATEHGAIYKCDAKHGAIYKFDAEHAT
jgi:hypothetical protein